MLRLIAIHNELLTRGMHPWCLGQKYQKPTEWTMQRLETLLALRTTRTLQIRFDFWAKDFPVFEEKI